jgi:hypothetical protein
VASVAVTDCWAVGEQFNNGAAAEETLVFRWDGSEWAASASNPPGGIHLSGVACSASGPCWTVGAVTNVSSSGGQFSTTSPPLPSPSTS